MPPKRAAQPQSTDQSNGKAEATRASTSQAHTDDQIGNIDADPGAADQRLQPGQPSTAAPPPARKPVQRLHSLHSRTGLSSTSTHLSNTPKALKYQPKAPLRRNQAEREAQDRIAAEKEVARIAQQATPSIRQSSSFTAPANRNAQYMRGGGSGLARQGPRGGITNRPSRFSGGGATGHLGSFVARGGTKGASRGKGRGVTAPTASKENDVTKQNEQQPTTSPTRGKKSAMVKVEGDKDGGGSRMSTIRSRRVKKEHSDIAPASTLPVEDEAEDTDASGRKLNIDFINLLSDDESHDTEGSLQGDVAEDAMMVDDPSRSSQRSQQHSFPTFRPIRLERQEHVDRPLADTVAGPSSSTYLSSAELRRRAKAKTDAEGSLFIDDDDDDDDLHEKRRVRTGRVRGKGRDVEVLGRRKVWKGAWEDEDDDEVERQVKIKEEPMEEQGLQGDLEQSIPADSEEPAGESKGSPPSQGADPAQAPAYPPLERHRNDEQPVSSSTSSTTSSSDSEAPDGNTTRQNHRRTSPSLPSRFVKPRFQTAEELDEWQRYEQDLHLMNDILRSGQPPVPAVGSRTRVGKAQSDADASDAKAVATAEEEMDLQDGETKKEDGTDTVRQENVMTDVKAGRIYMLQLPPLLPAMEIPKQKQTETATPASSAPPPPITEPNTPERTPAVTTQSKKTSSSSAFSASNKKRTRNPSTKSSSAPDPTPTNIETPHPEPEDKPQPDPTPPPSTLTPLTSPTSLPSGRIGYLRMHASSRITLSWGDMLFSLNRNASDGAAAAAAAATGTAGGGGGSNQGKGGTLQEVVVMNYDDDDDDGKEEGDADRKQRGKSKGGGIFTVKVEEAEEEEEGGRDGQPMMEDVRRYGERGAGDEDAMDVDDDHERERAGASGDAITGVRADDASPMYGRERNKGKQREESGAGTPSKEKEEEEEDEEEDDDKGGAWAIGEINGGFVGVPEWEAMFS